ncbi:MAG: Bor/Iss family lipoprotein [Salinivenus sp.]
MSSPKTRLPILAILLSLALVLTGCYHAQVTTGKQASNEVVENTFAPAWINGLVPPSVVETAQECENGVARVETRLSFPNMLVGSLTFGIFTPMHIKATCATSESMSQAAPRVTIPESATEKEIREALDLAATQSADVDQSVPVRFE